MPKRMKSPSSAVGANPALLRQYSKPQTPNIINSQMTIPDPSIYPQKESHGTQSCPLQASHASPSRQFPSTGSDDRQRYSPTGGGSLSLDDYESRQEVWYFFIAAFWY